MKDAEEKDILVIGDVHGHYDRLQALLEQEGLLDEEGNRVNKDVIVLQLGDLGHFGGASGSPTGDKMCWEVADNWLDFILWGNHDRAVVDPAHCFNGYGDPRVEVVHMMKNLEAKDRLRMAFASHGYLMTHAGLHAQWKYQDLPEGMDRDDPYEVADYINSLIFKGDDGNRAVFDAVGRTRGGYSPFGGILWRDFSEKLYNGFPQIFGHSASREHKVRRDPTNIQSWCIDIGGKGDTPGAACLAGIWLRTEQDPEVVRVDL